MKVVLDMNMSPEWVDVLNGEDIEAIHWSNVANWRADDDEIVRWASANGQAILPLIDPVARRVRKLPLS